MEMLLSLHSCYTDQPDLSWQIQWTFHCAVSAIEIVDKNVPAAPAYCCSFSLINRATLFWKSHCAPSPESLPGFGKMDVVACTLFALFFESRIAVKLLRIGFNVKKYKKPLRFREDGATAVERWVKSESAAVEKCE